MLSEGRYPRFLKTRIESERGHLGNKQVSVFIADILNPELRNICLAHLSKNNNTPGIALKTLEETLTKRGIKLNSDQSITILNRNMPTDLISLTW